jgi:methyl-accepting chemotaxis protein
MRLSFLTRLFLANLALLGLFTLGIWCLASFQYVQGFYLGALAVVLGSFVAAALARVAAYLSLRQPLVELNSYSDSFSKSTIQLADASQLVSSASFQQAAAIQQSVATVTELNATIKKSVDAAHRSREAAEGSHGAATEGHRTVTEMILAIDEIDSSNNAIILEIDKGNQRINDIVKVITEISTKTKVINDIVFQTKLLSFNASVEAARAGEHGKGFAVVAEEIGNLAQMSGTASREISEMLNTSIQTVNSILEETTNRVQSLIQNGKSKVSAGIVVARRCGEVLQVVVDNVTQVNSMISEISLASKEQANGMSEIASAMAQLDTVTQQNANTARNAADYSAQLFTQTKAFQQTLNALRGGRSSGPSKAEAVALKSAPKAKKVANNVHEFKAKNKPTVNPRRAELREAVGAIVPSKEDPGFEDV